MMAPGSWMPRTWPGFWIPIQGEHPFSEVTRPIAAKKPSLKKNWQKPDGCEKEISV